MDILTRLSEHEDTFVHTVCFLGSPNLCRLALVAAGRRLRQLLQSWPELWRISYLEFGHDPQMLAPSHRIRELPARTALSWMPSVSRQPSSAASSLNTTCREIIAHHRIAHSLETLSCVQWTRLRGPHLPRPQECHSGCMIGEDSSFAVLVGGWGVGGFPNDVLVSDAKKWASGDVVWTEVFPSAVSCRTRATS